jgi:hypothetical protein
MSFKKIYFFVRPKALGQLDAWAGPVDVLEKAIDGMDYES